MSTFSSVVRKPGQKITPKVAPRRNVQRTTARLTAPTPLTPESLSRSPALESIDKVSGQPENDGSASIPPVTLSDSEQRVTQSESEDDNRTSVAPSATPPLSHSSLPTVQIRTESSTVSSVRDALASLPAENTSVGRHLVLHGIPTVATSSTPPRTSIKRRISTSEHLSDSVGSRLQEAREDGLNQIGENNRKRRKTVPHAAPAVILSQGVASTASPVLEESSPQTRRSSSRRKRNDSQQADALILNATTQAAAVSSLANTIDGRTRLLRPRRPSGLPNIEEPITNEQESGTKLQSIRRRGKKLSSKNLDDITVTITDNAAAGSQGGRKRRATPENAEEYEIDPSAVHMSELTKDNKLGKGWDLGRKLQEKWPEVIQRRKDQMARNRERAAEKGRQGRQVDKLNEIADQQLDQVPAEVPVPSMTIVNGVITVTSESREVAFGSGLEQAAVQDAENALEDEKIYRYVHQGTLGKYAGLKRGTRWDTDATDLFYQGLRMFGTDFMMIANLFPGMTRKQIKLKYVKEERSNLSRIHESLKAREQVGVDEYSRMTNREFQDPQKLQDEIDAEEKRLRQEDEKRRAQEGFIHGDLDSILLTGDVGSVEPSAQDGETGIPERSNRLTSEAQGIVERAVAPKKRQRKPKDSVKARQPKKGRKPLEGVEERIGPIDEVER